MQQTIWALAPPAAAIILALATKEVYVSLFAGIIIGSLLLSGFNILSGLEIAFNIMARRVGDNFNIIIFLIILGTIVSLITKSGASRAYGKWAMGAVKSPRSALFGAMALGSLIFIDDYFNCLTVGNVMRPITDRYSVSRAKLAYVIDSTAAPVCIIAPISSWAAAVGSSLPATSGIDGLMLFIDAIPFNYYALTTLTTVIIIIALQFDFGPMKNASKIVPPNILYEESKQKSNDKNIGKVRDLLVPILSLICLCIVFMLYTGGFFNGIPATAALASSDAPLSLVLGAMCTLPIIFFMYVPRKIIPFSEFAQSITEGFRSMTPAIIILSLAWTLAGVCSEEYLDIGGFVSNMIKGNTAANSLLPPTLFLASLGLAFSTGTSWGTFGILIPIAVAAFEYSGSMFLTVAVAAVLAGAVCGDHISPISDTTILASTGADCSHIEHVKTQMPYALTAALASIIGFTTAGLTQNGYVGLAVSFAFLIIFLLIIYKKSKR